MANLEFTICPKCRIGHLRAISERKGGFSGGKAGCGRFFIRACRTCSRSSRKKEGYVSMQQMRIYS